MQPPSIHVHHQPHPDAEQAFHTLLDVLAGAIADDIFAKARAELRTAPAPEPVTPDEADLLGLGRLAPAGGRR